MQNLLKIAGKSSFMGKKIEFQGKESSFKLFGKIEFPSKRTKKPDELCSLLFFGLAKNTKKALRGLFPD